MFKDALRLEPNNKVIARAKGTSVMCLQMDGSLDGQTLT